MILYEYPLNERVRTFLRLEHLFKRLHFFAQQEDSIQHHVAITVLFDLLDVTVRADLKTELMQELDKQRTNLLQWRAHPNIDLTALDQTIRELDECTNTLMTLSGKIGQSLRSDEWLNIIRSRVSIPGGACEFDLPNYYLWQQRPASSRQADLKNWIAVFEPLYGALQLVVKMIRETASFRDVVAGGGAFQEMLGGKSYQLLRLSVDSGLVVFPEFSVNKHMISIRFFDQKRDLTALPSGRDIPFQLALCTN